MIANLDLEDDSPKQAEPEGPNLYELISAQKTVKYSVEDKLAVALKYSATGSLTKTAKETGVPLMTISDWKNKTEWWEPAVRECRKRKQDELDGKLTEIIDNALEQVTDRVLNGDSKVTKDGIVKVPMSGKELSWVAGILFDKRAALRGDPINITKSTTAEDQMKALENKFEEFARKMDANGALAKPIEGEFEEE